MIHRAFLDQFDLDCLLYTSDASDELICVDISVRLIIQAILDLKYIVHHLNPSYHVAAEASGITIDSRPKINSI